MDDFWDGVKQAVIDALQDWVCYLLGITLNYVYNLVSYIMPYIPTIPYDLSFLGPHIGVAFAFVPIAAIVYCLKLYVSYRVFVFAYGLVKACIPGF